MPLLFLGIMRQLSGGPEAHLSRTPGSPSRSAVTLFAAQLPRSTERSEGEEVIEQILITSLFGCYPDITSEALAKVSNGHPPQPLPSKEGLIYQSSPLVAYGSEPTAQRGEGKGEGVIDFCKSLNMLYFHLSDTFCLFSYR